MSLSKLLTTRTILAAATILLAGLLLFVHLGHYALWDDESYTALAAKAVLATGDTSAVVGHNIVACRSGKLLENLHDRTYPPLPAYLCAAFIGVFGESSGIARLPFALLGLAGITIMLRWALRDGADSWSMAVLGIAIIGNISLILYLRQCRYYSLSLFFCIAIAYFYVHFDGRIRTLVFMSAASIGLLATNQMHYAAIYLCLAADYLIWGRKHSRLGWRDWLILFGPQVLIGLPLSLIWNPSHGTMSDYAQQNTIPQRLELIWMYLRDINRCEFVSLTLIAMAPILWWFKRDPWLLRALLSMVILIVVGAIFSPQFLPAGSPIADIQADVRYIVPVIPLGIGLGTLVLCRLFGKSKWIAVVVALPIFLTNLLNQSIQLDYHVSSTLWKYVGELWSQPPDPYTVTSQWIINNVQENQSIWIVPNFRLETAGFQTYPLMYLAPKAIYAWQIPYPPDPQFEHLPEINFYGRVLPDYIIAFGPTINVLLKDFHPPAGVSYKSVAFLNVFWKDQYRPELFWRSFEATPVDLRKGEGVYIFKKNVLTQQPAPPKTAPQPTAPGQTQSGFHL